MPSPPDFTPSVRRHILNKSNFHCIWCHTRIGIEVHHLEKDKGNSEDNGAALCPNCHRFFCHNELYGANFIKQVRDVWYEQVRQGLPINEQMLGQVEEHKLSIEEIKKEMKKMQDYSTDLSQKISNIQVAISEGNVTKVKNMLPEFVITATNMSGAAVKTFGSSLDAEPIKWRYCERCGPILAGGDDIYCPNCKLKLIPNNPW